jgi:hypothetical protein
MMLVVNGHILPSFENRKKVYELHSICSEKCITSGFWPHVQTDELNIWINFTDSNSLFRTV